MTLLDEIGDKSVINSRSSDKRRRFGEKFGENNGTY